MSLHDALPVYDYASLCMWRASLQGKGGNAARPVQRTGFRQFLRTLQILRIASLSGAPMSSPTGCNSARMPACPEARTSPADLARPWRLVEMERVGKLGKHTPGNGAWQPERPLYKAPAGRWPHTSSTSAKRLDG